MLLRAEKDERNENSSHIHPLSEEKDADTERKVKQLTYTWLVLVCYLLFVVGDRDEWIMII